MKCLRSKKRMNPREYTTAAPAACLPGRRGVRREENKKALLKRFNVYLLLFIFFVCQLWITQINGNQNQQEPSTLKRFPRSDGGTVDSHQLPYTQPHTLGLNSDMFNNNVGLMYSQAKKNVFCFLLHKLRVHIPTDIGIGHIFHTIETKARSPTHQSLQRF